MGRSLSIQLEDLIQCPNCKGDVYIEMDTITCPNCKASFPIVDRIPIMLDTIDNESIELSRNKWDTIYCKQMGDAQFERDFREYQSKYLTPCWDSISKYIDFHKALAYIEIGCGPFYFGNYLGQTNKDSFVVGIDFSFSALKIAKYLLEKNGVENYLLVCCDINKMPLKNGIFDIAYGGGVIEHFRSTESILQSLHYILRKGGYAFNTVPALNIGSLTYRQIWGNIPDVYLMKEVFEFIHIKLLKGRHMRFGYEKSFTKGKLIKMYAQTGFNQVVVERYPTFIELEYIPSLALKDLMRRVVESSDLFYPMLYVVGKK